MQRPAHFPVGAVRNNDAANFRADGIDEIGPGAFQRAKESAVELGRHLGRAGEALNHGIVCQSDDHGVHGVVAVVAPCLFSLATPGGGAIVENSIQLPEGAEIACSSTASGENSSAVLVVNLATV